MTTERRSTGHTSGGTTTPDTTSTEAGSPEAGSGVTKRSGGRARHTEGLLKGALRGLGLALVSLPLSVLAFTLTLVSIALIPAGVGIVTTPYVLDGARTYANWR